MTDKTLGGYIRTSPAPYDMDGGVAAALIEKEVGDREDDVTLLRHDLALMERRAEKAEEVADLRRSEIVRLSQDRNDWEGNALDAEDRAEKAEQERDEARKHLHDAEARIAELRAEQPRPLTPEDVDDEMVKRARKRGSELVGALWDHEVVEAMIVAALTVPARPEGAEEIEAELIAFEDTEQPHTLRNRADWLASRGVRVTEDGAA